MTRKSGRSEISHRRNADFVVDGNKRAIGGIEAEVRPEVERMYSDELNTSGLIKRWFLLRRIEREIANRVTDRLKYISPDSMF